MGERRLLHAGDTLQLDRADPRGLHSPFRGKLHDFSTDHDPVRGSASLRSVDGHLLPLSRPRPPETFTSRSCVGKRPVNESPYVHLGGGDDLLP
jgi:hypothetical protein